MEDLPDAGKGSVDGWAEKSVGVGDETDAVRGRGRHYSFYILELVCIGYALELALSSGRFAVRRSP